MGHGTAQNLIGDLAFGEIFDAGRRLKLDQQNAIFNGVDKAVRLAKRLGQIGNGNFVLAPKGAQGMFHASST